MRIVLITLALLLSIAVNAQNSNRVGINEITLTTNKGDKPAFEFFMPDIDAKTVLDGWNKFHKNYKTKPKRDKNQSNYYFTDNAQILALSENTIDIYARIYETGGGVRFACAFDLGGVFISSRKTPDKFSQAKLLLNKFYAQMAMDAIVAEIEMELKALEEIRTEYTAINEEIVEFETKSKTYKANIESAEEEELKLETELQLKSGELADQRSELTKVKSELKAINKQGIVADLTGYSDELKKVNLETTKIEKDIVRKEAEIEALQADINLMKNDLGQKKDRSRDLQEKITDIELRLEELNIEDKEDNLKLLESNINALESLEDDLSLSKSTYRKTITQEEAKLDKVEQAIRVSRETRALLEEKLESQEKKLRELEEIKATIE